MGILNLGKEVSNIHLFVEFFQTCTNMYNWNRSLKDLKLFATECVKYFECNILFDYSPIEKAIDHEMSRKTQSVSLVGFDAI